MKIHFSLLVILVVLLCSGCSKNCLGTYVLCKEEDGVQYVRDATGNLYTYDTDLRESKVRNVPEVSAMSLYFTGDDSYDLKSQMPTVYSGTKSDFVGYLTKLLQESESAYYVKYCDVNTAEVLVTTTIYDVRLMYTSDDTIRIYCSDKNGNGITPPYLD